MKNHAEHSKGNECPGASIPARSICLTSMVCFATVLLSGLLVPVYADEVALQMMRTVFFSEAHRVLTLMPQCGPDLGITVPYSLYPAAALADLIFGGLPPIAIRFVGVITAFVWSFLLIALVFLLFATDRNRMYLISGSLSILGLGVLPWTLVLARPEQWLLLLLTTVLTLTIFNSRRELTRHWIVDFFILFFFCLISSLIFFSHPKSLFFLPFLLVSAYQLFRERGIVYFLAVLAYLLIAGYQTFEFARISTSCADAPILQGYLKSQTTDIFGLLRTPIETSAELFFNLLSASGKIAGHLVYQRDYQSAWILPLSPPEVDGLLGNLNFAISYLVQTLIWLGVAFPMFSLAMAFRERRVDQRTAVTQGLWLGFVGHLAVYKAWNFYGGSFAVGIAILLIHLSARYGCALRYANFVRHYTSVGLLIVFVTSGTILLGWQTPAAFDSTKMDDVAITQQPLSVQGFGFEARRRVIREFAEICGLRGDGSRRLVVDDLTYFAFSDLREPLHLVYFYEGGFGADVKGRAVIGMLERLGSEGIIAQCTFMPSALAHATLRRDGLCCVKLPLETPVGK